MLQTTQRGTNEASLFMDKTEYNRLCDSLKTRYDQCTSEMEAVALSGQATLPLLNDPHSRWNVLIAERTMIAAQIQELLGFGLRTGRRAPKGEFVELLLAASETHWACGGPPTQTLPSSSLCSSLWRRL